LGTISVYSLVSLSLRSFTAVLTILNHTFVGSSNQIAYFNHFLIPITNWVRICGLCSLTALWLHIRLFNGDNPLLCSSRAWLIHSLFSFCDCMKLKMKRWNWVSMSFHRNHIAAYFVSFTVVFIYQIFGEIHPMCQVN